MRPDLYCKKTERCLRQCRSCAYTQNRARDAEINRQWRERNWLRRWAVCKARNLENISVDFLLQLVEKQGMACAVTRIPFRRATPATAAWGPSLDRIDPKGGYVPSNVRVVLFAVNTFLGRMSDEEALFVAKKMVEGLKK